MTNLYIVRHCQAKANVDKMFQGRFDGDVTDLGKRQLELLSERFKNIKLDAVYTSPLKRATLTAKAVAKYNNAPIKTDDDLIEINVGDMEKMYIDDIKKQYPEQSDNWYNNPKDFVSPNGESMSDVYKRAKKAVLNIINNNKDKTVAITSHGCLIRNMLCFLHKLELKDINNVGFSDNTAVSKIQINGSEYNIIYESDLSHFDDDMNSKTCEKWYEK